MLTLDLTNAPRWHDLASGVRVQLRPLTTALMVATRSDPAVEAVPEDASDEERAVAFAKPGGPKEMQFPEGAAQPRRPDSALVKALARAFRWKRLLESGEFTTIVELAEREGIASSYMARILRLTLLAPDMVEALLDGKQGPEVTLAQVLELFPMEWAEQLAHFGQIG